MRESTGLSLAPSRADLRRQRILDSARALFIKHGFHQTGVALIAEGSGVKIGQIYRDFASKEDIIAAISRSDIADWLEKGLESAVADGELFAIRKWIKRFVSLEPAIDQCRILTEIVAEAARNERIAGIYREIDVRSRECLAEALETLAPRANRAGRDRLIGLILMLSLGLAMRRTIGSETDMAALSRHASEIVDWELDQLAGAPNNAARTG